MWGNKYIGCRKKGSSISLFNMWNLRTMSQTSLQDNLQGLSLSSAFFQKIWDNLGPFTWDLMASQANVNKDVKGRPLLFFSRYYDEKAQGVDVFLQQLSNLKEMFCFPPIPMISKLLKHLEQEKVSCVLLIPTIWAPWSSLLHKDTLATVSTAKPYEDRAFSVTHTTSRRISKKYPYFMDAVYVSFE